MRSEVGTLANFNKRKVRRRHMGDVLDISFGGGLSVNSNRKQEKETRTKKKTKKENKKRTKKEQKKILVKTRVDSSLNILKRKLIFCERKREETSKKRKEKEREIKKKEEKERLKRKKRKNTHPTFSLRPTVEEEVVYFPLLILREFD